MHTQTNDLGGPPRQDIALEAVLHALSDPIRLGIVASLGETDDERRCGSFGAPVTKSTLTHHFRVLREAGVICQRQGGTSRLSRLRRADLDARFPGLLDAILRSEEPSPADLVAAAQHRRELDRRMSMSDRLAALHELCKQLAPVDGAAKPR